MRFQKLPLLWATLLCLNVSIAWTQSGVQEAQSLMVGGQMSAAAELLETLAKANPNNTQALNLLCFNYFLDRQFAQSIAAGKKAIQTDSADERSYQVLGMAYKAIALYNDAASMYKAALLKFPNSGVLYHEYGENQAMNKRVDEAIQLWEKGMELAPFYPYNYYDATKYHADRSNWVKAILFAEIFVNMERNSVRSKEIMEMLPNAYANLFNMGQNAGATQLKLSPFEKAVLESFNAGLNETNIAFSMTKIEQLRNGFVANWYKSKNKFFPYRLFDWWKQIIDLKYGAAYNHWLLGQVYQQANHQQWISENAATWAAFLEFQSLRVFKMPLGQFYFKH